MYWCAKAFIKIKDSPPEQFELKADSCCLKYTYYTCVNRWQEDYFTLLGARNGRKSHVSGNAFCISTS